MQTTSAAWKALWAGGNARLESVAVINGVEYGTISAPVISRALAQDGLSVGNTVSATCQFSVLTEDAIPKAAEVKIKMRLTDGETASEWLPAGTFFISRRTRDPITGLLTLECYDALLKGNAEMPALIPWTTSTGEAMTTSTGEMLCFNATWPRYMSALATELALLLGVTLDPRSLDAIREDYLVEQPEDGTAINGLLSLIGATNGGNWIITPENQLRLVPIRSAHRAAGATEDVAEVPGVVGGISVGETVSISGIRYYENDAARLVGDETGAVIEANVTADQARTLATWLLGMTHQTFALEGAVYDPAAELGDYVRRSVAGEAFVSSVLYAEKATLGPAFRGDISAPEPGELADEYPYIGATRQALASLRAGLAKKPSKEYVDGKFEAAAQVTAALDASLNQQGVFNRLTNNGAAQGLYIDENSDVYVNATYIGAGVLNAGLLRVGTIADDSGKNYWVLDGANSEFVTKKGIIGDFTLEDGALKYGTYGEGSDGIMIDKNGVRCSDYDPLNPPYYTLFSELGASTRVHLGTFGLPGFWLDTAKGAQEFRIWSGWTSAMSIRQTDTRTNIEFGPTFPVQIDNSLTVLGTKSRSVTTDQYADRLLYCYETPSPMFGDVGEGEIGEDGKCYIWLDPVFAQTVATDSYQVFLQRYGSGECWIAERRPGCFVVEGSPGLRFGWEIKAKQRDFDQKRLERDEAPFTVPEQAFGEDAAAHLADIAAARLPAA